MKIYSKFNLVTEIEFNFLIQVSTFYDIKVAGQTYWKCVEKSGSKSKHHMTIILLHMVSYKND